MKLQIYTWIIGENKITEYITLTKKFYFSASHRLYINGLSEEDNFKIFDKCSNLNGHGHDYIVEIRISGEIDKKSGMVHNHLEFEKLVEPVINEFDYKWIDKEVKFFADNQSTVENIGRYLWDKLKDIFHNKINYIKVWENPRSYFEYYEESSVCL